MVFQRSFARLGRDAAALCLCAAALSSCNTLHISYADVKCPYTDVTGQLASVSRFTGEGGNIADLTYHARLADLKGNCDLDDDGVTITVTVSVIADIGPAATDRSANFPYFVAIVGPNNRIIAKKNFDETLTFPPNRQHAGATETLTQFIPLRDPHNAPDYHVFVGFQLTQAEVEYNRVHGGL
jgi:hypothetical protein